jgi:hypothetical protein
MINLIEAAARKAVDHLLPDGHQSLGIHPHGIHPHVSHTDVSHTTAMPAGGVSGRVLPASGL